ncbi:hypothetical protein LX36DRAFT_175644 [Colletotrichum falcatum]|nr:hypothetical protein LX36DRAFT_175644 [Colletotrichum falcatum]
MKLASKSRAKSGDALGKPRRCAENESRSTIPLFCGLTILSCRSMLSTLRSVGRLWYPVLHTCDGIFLCVRLSLPLVS